MSEIIKNIICEVGTDISGKWVMTENVEKIALQIIKECAKAADKNVYPSAYNAYQYNYSLINQLAEPPININQLAEPPINSKNYSSIDCTKAPPEYRLKLKPSFSILQHFGIEE